MADAQLQHLDATVTPAQQGERWVLSFGDTTLEASAAAGGRITSFRMGDAEVLTGADVNPDNWGSTFWPSPQSAWGWPPPPELDTVTYAARLDGNVLELAGPPVAEGGIAGLAITKRLSANEEHGVVCIEYLVTNHSQRAVDIAGWEISRVPRSNLDFFPEGTVGEVKKFQDLLPLASAGGVAWLQYDPSSMDRDLLVGRHGAEGWLASVRGDLLFIKQYPEVPVAKCAPGEAELLLFLNGSDAYVELETQSALERLEPGAVLSWPVRWYVRRLPARVAAELGSQELVESVRSVLVP